MIDDDDLATGFSGLRHYINHTAAIVDPGRHAETG